MVHGEYITNIAINKSGSLLVSTGIDTFRVWELSTGLELSRIKKQSKARVLTISFGSADNHLVVGYDDCMVCAYDLKHHTLLWKFQAEEDDGDYHPCLRVMTLSPDVTKVATAFRGRPVLIWDMLSSGPEKHPIRCIRVDDLKKQESDAFDQLDSVTWYPDGMSVFVLYQDASIVRFYLTDEETVENRETSARELVISQDGNLLLTCDHAGTLSLWSLPKFQLVYRLPYEEFVRDLAFSPDSQRFYDVRGAICNVWEPDILVRAEELDHEESSNADVSDDVSDPILSGDNSSRSQITSLVTNKADGYYLCGKDDGSVVIHDMKEGNKIRKVYNHSTSVAVIALEWSPTGRHIASGDDCGRVLAKKLDEKTEPGKWAVYPRLDLRFDEQARHFVFEPEENFVLISLPTSDRIYELKTKMEIWRRDREYDLGIRWMIHPSQTDLIVCVEPSDISIHPWSPTILAGLQPRSSSSRSPPSLQVRSVRVSSEDLSLESLELQNAAGQVRSAALSDNGKTVICEIISGIGQSTRFSGQGLRLELISSDDISPKRSDKPTRRSVAKLAGSVARFLGCYQDHIVFINHQYWICTWPLSQNPGTLKRHFFMPKDWVSPSSLPLIRLVEDGTFLFPKNGEVAIVKSGLKL
jgi:WD40 repeat protein